MGRPKHSIDEETLASIEIAIKAIPKGPLARKLTILSSYTWLTTEQIAKAYRINPRTLFRWIQQFKERGVEGLVDNQKGHRQAILNEDMKSDVIKWITTQQDDDGKPVFWTLDKLRSELARVYSVKISKPALSVNLAKMKISLRRPRPTHACADQVKQEDYKKNSGFPQA